MRDPTVRLTEELRYLIKLGRTDIAGLSQRQAALEAGHLSESWWRQVETGVAKYATVYTLAKMCYAVSISPRQLQAIGEHTIADQVERRLELLDPPTPDMKLEFYLMGTPGLDDTQRKVLVMVALGLKTNNQITNR